jgi:hypothetical protein
LGNLYLRARHTGAVVLLVCLAGPADAQTASPATLPDAPSTTEGGSSSATPPGEIQTPRVLGIMPNFRSVSPGAAVPPASPREKFVTATQDNFDYSALVFGGIIAADAFFAKETPEFHQGAAGYARYYWHTVADQSIQNYLVEAIIPTLGHEDSRYYAMGKDGGGVWRRATYALSRAVVTRSDSGKPMFNYAQIVGSGIAVSISNFYYPSKERTVANGLRNYGQDVGYDAVTFMFHEFWPDISNAIFHPHTHGLPSPTN